MPYILEFVYVVLKGRTPKISIDLINRQVSPSLNELYNAISYIKLHGTEQLLRDVQSNREQLEELGVTLNVTDDLVTIERKRDEV